MNGIADLFGNPVLQRIGIALLHSLWQIALIAIAVTLLLRIGQALKLLRSANSRYVIQCCGLLLMLLAPIATFSISDSPAALSERPRQLQLVNRTADLQAREWGPGVQFDGAVETNRATPINLERIEPGFPPQHAKIADVAVTSVQANYWLTGLAWLWLLGALVMLGHSMMQWSKARQLSLTDTSQPPIEVLAPFEKLIQRMGLSTRIQLKQSKLVDVPTLIGWLKPIILLPPAMVSGLSAREFELILLHELIHIKRHDYLVNVMQTGIESLLFYHPCVWWLSKQIRTEREFAADEEVVRQSSDQITYARALLQLEQCRSGASARTSPALAATDGSLLIRVQRIVESRAADPPMQARNASKWFLGTGPLINHSLTLRARIPLVLITLPVLVAGTCLLASSLFSDLENKYESKAMPRYSDNFTRMQRPDLSFGYGDADINDMHPWQAPFGLASREIDYDDGWELWCAAADGKTDIVKRLIEKETRLKDLAFRYHCPLDLAVYGGHTQCVEILLDADTELTEKWGWYGWKRMLGIAKEMGHDEIHDLMLQRIKIKSNYHPDIQLMIQTLCDQDVEAMKQLLDEDAERVNVGDEDGNTALHWAAFSRQIPMIDLLVERGADPSRRNGAHAMPHQVKMWTSLKKELVRGLDDWSHVKAAQDRLLELGAEVDFHTAIGRGDLEQVRKMLAKDKSLVHHMLGHLGSPLNAAVGNLEMLQLLLEHKADPNMTEHTAPFGCALYTAVSRNEYESAELLLKNGAEPMQFSDSSGDTLFAANLWIKDKADRKRMIELLNEHSGKEHIVIPQRNDKPEHEVAAAAVREVLARDTVSDWQVRHLLEVILLYRDADLLEAYLKRFGDEAKSRIAERNARGFEGRLLELLTEHGAEVKPVDTSVKWMGATKLHWNKDVAFVSAFVDAGGDVNAVNIERQRTALSSAADRGDIELVRELLKHGADPNLPAEFQAHRPMELAQKGGHEEIVALLKESLGFDVNQPNTEPDEVADAESYKNLVDTIIKTRNSIVQARLKFIIDPLFHDRSETSPRHYQLYHDGNRFRFNQLSENASFNQQLVEIYTPEYGVRLFDDQPLQRWGGKPEPKIDPDYRKFGLIPWFVESVNSRSLEENLLPEGARDFSFEDSADGLQRVVKFEADVDGMKWNYEIGLAKKQGYQPVLLRRVSKVKNKTYDLRIENELSVIDGIWFPTSTKFQYYIDGEYHCSETMNVVQIDFGRGSHEAFDLDTLDGFEMEPFQVKSNSPKTLHQAATSGDIVSIQRLLDAGADKTLRNEVGDTPCCLAIRNLASQEVIELLDFEGNPRRNPELWGAAFAGDLKKVKELIEAGADPNAYDENGSGTLLNFHPEITKYLLSKGANPDLQRNENILPVLVGIAGFNTECLKAMLDAGADANVSSHHNGETALHHSVCGDNFEQVKSLLDAGADPNRQTLPGKKTYMLWRDARVRGETPLHRAAAYGTPEIIKLLLDAGADPNIRDANGDSPLSWASWHMRDKAIVDLLDNAMSDGTKGSTDDVNKSKTQRHGDHGEGDQREQHSESTSAPSASPRFKDLAKKGDFEKLHELWQSDERFDLGAVFERAVTDFRTVKHNDGHQQILQFCIDKGLDPLARVDWMKQPAICTAAMYGNIELIEYVANGVGLPEDPFVRASVGDVQYLKTFAESKGDDGEKVISELRDENGFNLLHYATASGLGRTNADYKSKLESTCKFLIECGVATNLVVENEIPLTPALMCAWFGGNPDIMQKLIDAGQIKINELHQAVEFAFEPHQRSGEPFEKVANVILKNGFDINSIYPAQKRTLLHGSSNRGSIEAVKWLLKNGADPNKLDDEGRTSLHSAAIRNSHTSVVKLLVDHGADTSVADNAGNTASDLAKAKGRDKVVSFFEDLAQVRSTGFSRKPESIPPEGGTTNISVSSKENSGSTTAVEKKFWDAMQSGDWETAKECLAKDQSLAGKDFDPENRDTYSFPLWQATKHNNLEMVRRLLDAGADPDAKKTPPFPEGVRETGMPLMNALSHGNFEMINMLLDAGADVHAHPNCDVPFETRVYNAALATGAPKNMVWKGFSDIDADMKAQIKPIAADAAEIIKLFDRVLSLGGHPNHYAIAIAKDYETIEWLLKNHPTAESRDHWGGNVHEAFLYGSAWHGDARTVELCMEICRERHTTYAAAHCIRNAITSHNRKGMFEDYRRVIELNLDYLKERDAFYEHDFLYPLHLLAHKFISDFYYGPLGEDPTVEHQLALAQLCLDKGFDVNLKTHDSGETALSLAIAEGHKSYIEFLRTNGAEEPDAKTLQKTKEFLKGKGAQN